MQAPRYCRKLPICAFKNRNVAGISSRPPTISKRPSGAYCINAITLTVHIAHTFFVGCCWGRAPWRSRTYKYETHWQRHCASVMLHPAFLSAGSEWAEASFQTPAGTSSCCLPPETDAGAAAAPRSKRRRHGPGGISKVQCPRNGCMMCMRGTDVRRSHAFDMHMLQEAKQQQQAFTKRKRTIMDKAFEMSQAADAKVGDLMIGPAE